MAGFRNSILGGINLIRAAIRSPNYVQGSTGWTINQDGSAEFNNLVIRNGTIVSGTALYYNGTPGVGTLFMSIAAAAGTDTYGNAYVQGIAVYATDGSMVQLLSGAGAEILLQPQSSPGVVYDPALIHTMIGGSGQAALNLTSGTTHPGTNEAAITLQGTSGTISVTQMQLAADFVVASKAINVGTAITQFGASWQTPSLGSGWAAGPSGGTVQAAQYRVDAEDNIIICGTVHTTSTTPASTIFTLPVGYRPLKTQRVGVVSNSGGTPTARYLEINSNGNVSVNPALTTSSTDVYFPGPPPLGNIT